MFIPVCPGEEKDPKHALPRESLLSQRRPGANALISWNDSFQIFCVSRGGFTRKLLTRKPPRPSFALGGAQQLSTGSCGVCLFV